MESGFELAPVSGEGKLSNSVDQNVLLQLIDMVTHCTPVTFETFPHTELSAASEQAMYVDQQIIKCVYATL